MKELTKKYTVTLHESTVDKVKIRLKKNGGKLSTLIQALLIEWKKNEN